ncbi:MAG: VCBS repeat-containing protein, partial [Bacteroidota bacterium]
MKQLILPIFMGLFLFSGCEKSSDERQTNTAAAFELIDAKASGFQFFNQLPEGGKFDVFRYRNYYNGGGVSIADINNDGLPDIYMTGNAIPNKLFLNKGDFNFEDITEQADVAGKRAWSTGVTIADVNADGFLDIYVCNSGTIEGSDKENELFINNGDLTFKESAAEYGLNDEGFSTHSAFFDYDKDGDLDCYILNNSFRSVASLGYENIRHVRDELGGDKLYRNDNGQFVDVSESAGIRGSVIGFGLGIAISDVNFDGWDDLYISNDFFERDYLYINQQDGTFKDELESYMTSLSLFSMGADIADLNNDAYPEIFVTDMLPEDETRRKRLTQYDTWDIYQIKLKNDYYYQFMKNALQMNNGDGTFSEVAQQFNVHCTDWSWGALIADFDLNGRKDIFVCNGIYKDLTDQDFINYLASSETMTKATMGEEVDFSDFVDVMPLQRIPNYLFLNQENGEMINSVKALGLDQESHSNGAAYGDLDNDGDLDLVVNNVNQESFLYRNNTANESTNQLTLTFQSPSSNRNGIGTKVLIEVNQEIISYEHFPMRGFQSSQDYTAVIGLGDNIQADKLTVIWPNGQFQEMAKVASNQTLKLDQQNAGGQYDYSRWTKAVEQPLFQENQQALQSAERHKENRFSDFDRDHLTYHMLSKEGPALATGDVNGDGLEDIFIGGAARQKAQLLLQDPKGHFNPTKVEAFHQHQAAEDVDATFFDADQDGDLDLYVVSGGNEFKNGDENLQDRLYLNEKGQWTDASEQLPVLRSVGSCVRPFDYDKDGDLDLFIGTRVVPNFYGNAPKSYLLQNQGGGLFKDLTVKQFPDLRKLGMVTDAQWTDLQNDGTPELVVTGEWMPIRAFSFAGDRFTELPLTTPNQANGWWYSLEIADLNNDQLPEIIAGNLGLNAMFKASEQEPFEMYVKDFDQNGSVEQIFVNYRDGEANPIALRNELGKQLTAIKKRFVDFKSYAEVNLYEVFS